MEPDEAGPTESELVGLIEADHRAIERAVEGVRRQSGRSLVRAFWVLADRLMRHQLAEELVVLPELRLIPGAAPATERLFGIQRELEGRLTELERQVGPTVAFRGASLEFVAAVEASIDEERRVVLPRLTQPLDLRRRRELVERYATVRGAALHFQLHTKDRRTVLGRVPALAQWIRDSAAAVHQPRSPSNHRYRRVDQAPRPAGGED